LSAPIYKSYLQPTQTTVRVPHDDLLVLIVVQDLYRSHVLRRIQLPQEVVIEGEFAESVLLVLQLLRIEPVSLQAVIDLVQWGGLSSSGNPTQVFCPLA